MSGSVAYTPINWLQRKKKITTLQTIFRDYSWSARIRVENRCFFSKILTNFQLNLDYNVDFGRAVFVIDITFLPVNQFALKLFDAVVPHSKKTSYIWTWKKVELQKQILLASFFLQPICIHVNLILMFAVCLIGFSLVNVTYDCERASFIFIGAYELCIFTMKLAMFHKLLKILTWFAKSHRTRLHAKCCNPIKIMPKWMKFLCNSKDLVCKWLAKKLWFCSNANAHKH